LLKPEITQKVKLVNSPNAHQDLSAQQSPTTVTRQPSGLLKIAALFGNHRNRTPGVMLGIAVFLGAVSSTANHAGTIAVAQTIPVRSYPAATTPQATGSNLQFAGEASVPIEVAQPKTRIFRSVATAQPYPNGSEGDLYHPSDSNTPVRAGETTIGFSWPASGTLTSKFGRRWGRMHKGIDIAGPIGTPVNAAADGIVIAAGWTSGGYGNLVEVRHTDGTTTRYGHNNRLSVAVGQVVRQGQQVAEMGSTGHSTGSHLHFEIRPSGGDAVNPIAHLPANS
jgi:murein DD-endopeptidase MepM/ murein hydrolase activator NlpD